MIMYIFIAVMLDTWSLATP